MFPRPAPPFVPGELDDELDRWVDVLHGIWAAWVSLGSQGKAGPAAGSLAAREDAALEEKHPDWGPHEALEAGVTAGRLIDAAGHHLQGVAALYETRRTVHAPWPVVRAEIETISRATWILDLDAGAEARVARLWLERLNGAYHRKVSLEAQRAPSAQVKAARRDRDRVCDEIRRRFPNATTDMPSTGDAPKWDVGGETLPGLGASANAFVDSHLVGARRLYDGLSYGSHPNVARLDLIAAPIEVDGHTQFPHSIDADALRRLAALAALALYRGAWLCCGYFGYDGAVLEAWAGEAAAVGPEFFSSESP